MRILRKEQNFNVFRKYLKERKVDEESLVSSTDKLANSYVVKRFYAEARKKNGDFTPKLHLSGYALKTVKFFSFVDA